MDEYTIEHILPQNENLSAAWKQALGPDWERVQQTVAAHLGNLTLTGYNSEYSDRPFAEKRDMEGRLQGKPAQAQSGLGQLDTWNEAAIQERARAARRSGARRSGPRPSWMPRCSGGLSAAKAAATAATPSTIIRTCSHRCDARGVRGVPQGGARARSLRDARSS